MPAGMPEGDISISFRLRYELALALARRKKAGESKDACAKRLLIALLTEASDDELRDELEELRRQVKRLRDNLGKVAVLVLTRDQKQPLALRDAQEKVTELFADDGGVDGE